MTDKEDELIQRIVVINNLIALQQGISLHSDNFHEIREITKKQLLRLPKEKREVFLREMINSLEKDLQKEKAFQNAKCSICDPRCSTIASGVVGVMIGIIIGMLIGC